MGLFQKWFPSWYLKRQIVRQEIARLGKRYYEAVDGSRGGDGYSMLGSTGDLLAEDSGEDLRGNVRHQDENSGAFSGAVDKAIRHAFGTGFRLQSLAKEDGEFSPSPRITDHMAREFNWGAENHFNEWAPRADQRLLDSFNEGVNRVFRAFLIDGGFISIGRISNRPDRTIPYCIENLEIDRLISPLSEAQNPKIRGGVRYDDEGAPSSYFVTRSHPAETAVFLPDDEVEEIPAYFPNGDKKVHVIGFTPRLEQTISVPVMSSGVDTLRKADSYKKIYLLGAMQRACMLATVKGPDPTGMAARNSRSDARNSMETRHHTFASNQILYMATGEEMNIHNPDSSGANYGDFNFSLTREWANSLFGMPAEVAVCDWTRHNYSSAKMIQYYFRSILRMLRWSAINQYILPHYQCAISHMVIQGLVKAPGWATRKSDYLKSKWVAQIDRDNIEPVKEATGDDLRLAAKTDTLQNICAMSGQDWEEIMEQRARELVKQKALEEEFDIKFGSEPETLQPIEDGEDDEKKDKSDDDKSRTVIPLVRN